MKSVVFPSKMPKMSAVVHYCFKSLLFMFDMNIFKNDTILNCTNNLNISDSIHEDDSIFDVSVVNSAHYE